MSVNSRMFAQSLAKHKANIKNKCIRMVSIKANGKSVDKSGKYLRRQIRKKRIYLLFMDIGRNI